MVAQNALDFTLAIGDGNDPENFLEMGGLQQLSMRLSNRRYSHHGPAEDQSWQHGLPQAGMQQMTLTASGIFTDTPSEAIVRQQAFSHNHKNYHVKCANGDKVIGTFAITEFERKASMEGAVEYRLTLQNAGELNYEIMT